MNAARTRSSYYRLGVTCAVVMTGAATLILLWWGFSLRTALLIAILISCPLAALYAWWAAHRALQSANDVLRGATGYGQRKSGKTGGRKEC